MSFLGVVVLVAALAPLVTGGSYRRLADAPWRWGGLLALGLGLQLLLDTSFVPRSSWHSTGFGILVASYVLLVGFCAGNVLIRGMAVVLIGVALNGFVVTIDQGMPVHVPPDWHQSQGRIEATIKHHTRVPGDHLLVLTDIIVLRRLDAIVSFGDLIIAFGLVDVTFWASRRGRRAPARRRGATPGDSDDVDVDVVAAVADYGAVADPSDAPRSPPERRPVRVGAGTRARSGRSGRAAHATVAIQDALQRLERP
ncbi:MAG: hypothetical protein QOH10_892 [Actinomycetota bacterium]|nr:hypothetical protein [Actinomycetota bacterium]